MTSITPLELPLLPLRDVVVFPQIVVPLYVGRKRSIKALESAMAADKRVFLVAQKDPGSDDPQADDLYDIGAVAHILQMYTLPDGTLKLLVEGRQRARILDVSLDSFYSAVVEPMDEAVVGAGQADAIVRTMQAQFSQYAKLSKKVPEEVIQTLSGISDPCRLADTIATHLDIRLPQKQELLAIADVTTRIEHLMAIVDGELDLLQMQKRIRGRVKKQVERNQREYYLNEQMKAIQKEMGDISDSPDELTDLQNRVEEAGMSPEARKKASSELAKLKSMSPISAEATVVRSYLDWLVNVPWKKRSKVRNDIRRAQKILDEDHYGLDEVKERILEFLAVQGRVRKVKGPVLCLVGPPGVGKTSLGESIARATNRKYTRMALGGVRDEAEIRGHRRTYIGSLPGKLIQKMSKVGVRNPLFLLDEIDKMGMDNRGDPASALLEVLDPEQNHTFNDHYLEVDYDLSDVMFVCTSNSMNIPAALLDRMEIIRLPGYTEDEKRNIAERYLIPKQMKLAGIKKGDLLFSADAVLALIRHYTKEAGVRGLEREVAKICRKFIKEKALEEVTDELTITPALLEHYSGVKRFRYGVASDSDKVGEATGLAWTQVGGELLTIEVAVVPGKGQIVKTGSLGEVMQESIQAALTVVRSRAGVLGIEEGFHEKKDLHIHVPEGATPKDGPSAGIAICTAMVSALTGYPVRADVAMTGEITLGGQVLAIGGLKEKLLAAHRGAIKTVLIPEENEKDLKEIPDNLKADLEIIPVKWIDDVLKLSFRHFPFNHESSHTDGVLSRRLGKPANEQSVSDRGQSH